MAKTPDKCWPCATVVRLYAGPMGIVGEGQEHSPARPGRAHLVGLDGLRGLAAFAVFGLHLQHTRHQSGWFDRAYLAVDFFFLLSGFVIGLAYEPKLAAGMSFAAYARTRLVRLYPMVVAAAVLAGPIAAATGFAGPIWLCLVGQLTFIPFLWSPSMFPLNVPQWSLFFELFVNFLHAGFVRLLSDRILAAVVAASAVWLIVADIADGSGGAGLELQNFIDGLPRVLFSFAAGLLVSRLGRAGRLPVVRVPYLAVAAALAAVLVIPPWPWVPDWLLVLTVFPVLLILALASPPPGRLSGFAAWAGTVSYPLYTVQAPLLRLAGVLTPVGTSGAARALYWALVLTGIVGLAWALARFYDAPARRWLQRAPIETAGLFR